MSNWLTALACVLRLSVPYLRRDPARGRRGDSRAEMGWRLLAKRQGWRPPFLFTARRRKHTWPALHGRGLPQAVHATRNIGSRPRPDRAAGRRALRLRDGLGAREPDVKWASA